MIPKLYLITPQTNMHVGSGDANYGIVDKYVQKDAKTGIPIIHPSSLKGALREYFEEEVGWGKKSDEIKHIFGGLAQGGDENSTNGKYRFFTAELLAIPVRCLEKPYFLATSNGILSAFVQKAKKMGLALDPFVASCESLLKKDAGTDNLLFAPTNSNPITFNGTYTLEDFTSQSKTKPTDTKLLEVLGPDLAIFSDSDFKNLTEELPVIARNHLESGISDNLWYEEIVPHHTVFYTFIGVSNDSAHFTEFSGQLTDDKLVQIGANASIGYGFCEFKLLN